MSRILFLSRWQPWPPANGSKLRIYNLLRVLKEQHHVTLISFNDQPDKPVDEGGLVTICDEFHLIPWRGYEPESGKARLGFLSVKPRFLIDTFSPEMQHCIAEVVRRNAIDIVIASQIDMAVYRPYFGDLPTLFEEAEVGTLYEQYAQAASLKQQMRYGLTWAKHRRFLRQLLADYTACTVVSSEERTLLQSTLSLQTAIEVIPNCINLDDYAGLTATPAANTLIFTGAFTYQPNYEGMVWFTGQVFPLIRAEIPEARLIITGNHGGQPLPDETNVTRTGFVEDIRPVIAGAWASPVPIWTGGGTRLKILEAMALGTPVIATSKGAEGLAVTPGKHLLLADEAQAFATAVIRLLRDPALRRRLGQDGLKLVETQYNWPVIAPQILRLVEHLTQPATVRAYNVPQGEAT